MSHVEPPPGPPGPAPGSSASPAAQHPVPPPPGTQHPSLYPPGTQHPGSPPRELRISSRPTRSSASHPCPHPTFQAALPSALPCWSLLGTRLGRAPGHRTHLPPSFPAQIIPGTSWLGHPTSQPASFPTSHPSHLPASLPIQDSTPLPTSFPCSLPSSRCPPGCLPLPALQVTPRHTAASPHRPVGHAASQTPGVPHPTVHGQPAPHALRKRSLSPGTDTGALLEPQGGGSRSALPACPGREELILPGLIWKSPSCT